MLINTSLPPESNTPNLQNSRTVGTPAQGVPNSLPASQTDLADPGAARLQGLADADGDGIPDSAVADQVSSFLRSSMLTNPGLVFAAQGSPNPDSVLNLLQ